MTLSIYAAQSSEANRLKNGLFEIYYDDTNNEIVIKNGSEQVYFNVLYNKEEINQLISQGVDPTNFENWLFNRIMIYSFATGSAIAITTLKELVDFLSRDMQALNTILNTKIDTNNVVEYNINTQPTNTQIYNAISLYNILKKILTNDNVIQWNDNVRPDNDLNIYNAQSLWDKITSIRECDCDCETINELLRYIDIIHVDDVLNNNFINVRANMQVNGELYSPNLIYKSDFKIRNLLHTENNLNSSIYEIDTEGAYDPFDPAKPIYGRWIMPCNITLNGTINGIHTDDILTKDDIDNLGASHFKFIDGAPMYKITNSVIHFLTNDTITQLIINLSDDVKNFRRHCFNN